MLELSFQLPHQTPSNYQQVQENIKYCTEYRMDMSIQNITSAKSIATNPLYKQIGDEITKQIGLRESFSNATSLTKPN